MKRTFIISIILLTIFGLISTTLLNYILTPREPAYLTVEEVAGQRDELAGHQIRVRGWTAFETGIASLLCDRCDCYNVSTQLWLSGSSNQTEDDSEQVRIYIAEFGCRGNGCRQTCSPFSADTADAYELVGWLVFTTNGDLALINLMLEESYQLQDGVSLGTMQRYPIDIGRYSIQYEPGEIPDRP